MRRAILILLLAMAACHREPADVRAAKEAEKHFEFLKAQRAMPAELCVAARSARDAWSRTYDKVKYANWNTETTNYCDFGGTL